MANSQEPTANSQEPIAKVCANRMQNQACLNYTEEQPKLNNEVVNSQQLTANSPQLRCIVFVIIFGNR